MKIKIIDDQDFPDLAIAQSMVEELLLKLDSKDVIALYVLVEGSQFGLFNLLTEETYKISGHEEEDDEVQA